MMLVAVACSSLGCGDEVVGVGSVTVKITPVVALAVGVGQTIDFSVTVNTMSVSYTHLTLPTICRV